MRIDDHERERVRIIREDLKGNAKERGGFWIHPAHQAWLLEHVETLHAEIDRMEDEAVRNDLVAEEYAQTRMRAEIFRQERNNAQSKVLYLEGALDRIRRIAADPVFRFYASGKTKQEILDVATQALKGEPDDED